MPPVEERVKLLLAPTFAPFRTMLGILRSLRVPEPLQRLAPEGLKRLASRLPELADLLDGRTRVRRPSPQPAPVAGSLQQLLLLFESRDYQTRTRAVRGLAHHREQQALDVLVSALRDRSVEVAVAAAHALALRGGAEAREALLSVLENVEGYYHPLTRGAAVQGLSHLLAGDQHAPLVQALRDLDAEVSIAAIAALSARTGHDDPRALIGVIANQDGFFLPITRLAAARALERLGHVPTQELSQLRAQEHDPAVAEALERLLVHAEA